MAAVVLNSSTMVPLYAPHSKHTGNEAAAAAAAAFYSNAAGPNHSRTLSASSASSLSSTGFDPAVHQVQDFSASVGYPDAFGPLPVNPTAGGSPFTDATSASSDADSPEGVPGGKKRSGPSMRRARSAADPYGPRRGSVSTSGEWSDRSESADDSDLADLLAPGSSSREGSIHSDWGGSRNGSVEPGVVAGVSGMHLDPTTGLLLHGPGGPPVGGGQHPTGFVDPYSASMAQQAFTSALYPGHVMASFPMSAPPGMLQAGMVPGAGMHMAPGLGMLPGGMAGLSVGSGMQTQGTLQSGQSRASVGVLESSETYEALAHHIRTSVTTSAADRARQAFVQAWLNSSYIAYTDGNVSRQGLYGSYLRICGQYDIKPINSASFGKAVRQCFPNIKTRRLGVRGNSKYHYCGIRPATAKEAEILMALSKSEQPEPAGGSHGRMSSFDADDPSDLCDAPGSSFTGSGLLPVGLVGVGQSPASAPGAANKLSLAGARARTSLGPDSGAEPQPQTPRTARPIMHSKDCAPPAPGASTSSMRSGAGRPWAFPDIEEVLKPAPGEDGNERLERDLARKFWKSYEDHCQGLLDAVKHYRFDQFELNMRTFWAGLDPATRETVQVGRIMSAISRADALLYDEILDYLHAQTLNQMPPTAFASLRSLAQNMEQVIIVALNLFDNVFVGPKIELAARFGHLITRHLGICQLSQALAGVFSSPDTLKNMLDEWDGIDFEAVRNQAALVTNCQHDVLSLCFDEFRRTLAEPGANVESFIAFVEKTYERCLQPPRNGEKPISPRSLLVRWTFVSSQLIRDLTLRSAACFGSYQIVNLFFDEWLGFKVLKRVALQVATVTASLDHEEPSVSGSGLLAVPPLSFAGEGAGQDGIGFLFSPNTAQAFAAAQAHVSGSAFGAFGADSLKTPMAPTHPNRGAPPERGSEPPSEHSGSSHSGSPSSAHSGDPASDVAASGDFAELMDVTAFSLAMGDAEVAAQVEGSEVKSSPAQDTVMQP